MCFTDYIKDTTYVIAIRQSEVMRVDMNELAMKERRVAYWEAFGELPGRVDNEGLDSPEVEYIDLA